jgi:hypothetical protein
MNFCAAESHWHRFILSAFVAGMSKRSLKQTPAQMGWMWFQKSESSKFPLTHRMSCCIHIKEGRKYVAWLIFYKTLQILQLQMISLEMGSSGIGWSWWVHRLCVWIAWFFVLQLHLYRSSNVGSLVLCFSCRWAVCFPTWIYFAVHFFRLVRFFSCISILRQKPEIVLTFLDRPVFYCLQNP